MRHRWRAFRKFLKFFLNLSKFLIWLATLPFVSLTGMFISVPKLMWKGPKAFITSPLIGPVAKCLFTLCFVLINLLALVLGPVYVQLYFCLTFLRRMNLRNTYSSAFRVTSEVYMRFALTLIGIFLENKLPTAGSGFEISLPRLFRMIVTTALSLVIFIPLAVFIGIFIAIPAALRTIYEAFHPKNRPDRSFMRVWRFLSGIAQLVTIPLTIIIALLYMIQIVSYLSYSKGSIVSLSQGVARARHAGSVMLGYTIKGKFVEPEPDLPLYVIEGRNFTKETLK